MSQGAEGIKNVKIILTTDKIKITIIIHL